MCWGLLRAICDGGGAGIQQVCIRVGVCVCAGEWAWLREVGSVSPGVWVSVGAKLGVGGLQCLWAGNVGGVSVMSIWGVGDGGGTARGAVSAESRDVWGICMCLGVY